MTTRAYEMMIIVDGDHEDAMVDDVVSRVESWLTEDANSKLVTTDKWGKRRFAYEIDHKTEGHYVVLEMVTGQRDMAPLERSLRLADEVVRHKLIRLPDHEATRRGLLAAG